ncbi:PH domain-containing protein [Sphingomonas sp. AOB5]|uniref:PH domain-containing protein n=1 Tax=Sphingomonas sp. AOB5 TaxID=3034017 RepID=UPI0023F74841|nr:PH domain-containing protein [Sphingomonas sp. AOB5]MDF7773979.1 PH domain-containing protein [Sphingomonas sp. AOB5]
MPLPVIPLEPLERGQLHVMRLRVLIFTAILMVPAAVVPFIAFPRELEALGVPLWAPGAVVAAIGLYLLLSAGRRWRRWGYAFTGRELHVSHGWLVHYHTIVPVGRVQHIDVSQGLFERMFGVATLGLHTAGTENSVVSLPGVTRETAEEIRDAIRGQIGGVEA